MQRHILLLTIVMVVNILFISYSSNAQCPAGGILFHNCGGSSSGGCQASCAIGVCTGSNFVGAGSCSEQSMSVTIMSPSPTCQMTVTGKFQNAPTGSSGTACNASGMDASDQLKVGLNSVVTGSSNAAGLSTYAGVLGEHITVSGQSNRRDEVITYSVSCTGTCTAVPTPVTFLYINSKTTNTGIILEWATASELNNDHFSIEYSNNGIDFKEVMIVKGSGTSNSVNTYEAEIKDRFIGTTYFRLKQHDLDGKVTVAPQVFSVINDADNDFFISYTEQDIYANVHVYHETSFELQIYSIIGTTLINKTSVDLSVGIHQIPININVPGIYVCLITLDNKVYSKKFVVY